MNNIQDVDHCPALHFQIVWGSSLDPVRGNETVHSDNFAPWSQKRQENRYNTPRMIRLTALYNFRSGLSVCFFQDGEQMTKQQKKLYRSRVVIEFCSCQPFDLNSSC
jgi:hypothetical protein